MKGFLISVVLIVAAGVILLTQYEKIGLWYLEKNVVAAEGGKYPNPTFDKLRAEDPAGFKAKYESALTTRCKVARFADLIGSEAFFVKLAVETREMYLNSSLA